MSREKRKRDVLIFIQVSSAELFNSELWDHSRFTFVGSLINESRISSRPINPTFPVPRTALSLTYIYTHRVANLGRRISLISIAMGWSLVNLSTTVLVIQKVSVIIGLKLFLQILKFCQLQSLKALTYRHNCSLPQPQTTQVSWDNTDVFVGL